MKNVIKIAAGVVFFLGFSFAGAFAQVTATGHITAEVIDAITAVESSPMNFGRFVAGDQGGSIVINPASGNVIATSTVIPSDNSINPASFGITGTTGATFSVTLPQGPTTLTNITGKGTLTVTNWVASTAQGTDDFVLAGGAQTVKVGATLRVGAADETPKGTYTGSYQVTFSYN